MDSQQIKHHKISIQYRVLRLIERDGQQILDSKITGLVPLTPLMGHSKDITDEQWFKCCVQVADSIEVPDKAAYLGRLVIFANLVYEPHVISKIILEETMQHASVVEYLAPHAHEQGKAEGKAEGKQEAVLQFLQHRFQNVPETLSRKISNIQNLSQLDTLLKQVMTAKSLEEIDTHVPE